MGSRRALPIALSFLVLFVAGCGGGGSDGEAKTSASAAAATTAALSKAELIKQGEAICTYIDGLVEEFEKTSFSPDEKADAAAGYYAGMVGELEELGVPQEDDGYSEFIATGEKLKILEGEIDRTFEFGKKTRLPALEAKASAALASFRETAGEYGFDECAKGPDLPALKPSTGAASKEGHSANG